MPTAGCQKRVAKSGLPPKKPTTTTPVKQSKPAPSPTKKPSKRKLPQKIRKGKPTFHLVDEEDEAQQEYNPQEEGNDPDLELAKKLSLETHQEKGKGEGDDADLELAIKLSLDPALLPQRQAPVGGVTIRDPVSETTPKLHEVVGKGKAVVSEEQVAHSLIDMSKKKRSTDQFILARRDQTPPDSTTGPSSRPDDDTSEKVIHESSSTSDSERTESDTESGAPKGDKVQGEIVSSTVTSGVSIPVSDPEKAHEAQAGPDPEPMQEDQTGSDSGKLHVSLAGPNPEHMDDEFIATAYPKVHENLKLITGERVLNDKPESHSGSMSSLKNLDDTVNFGDQFLHDQPTEDDQEKSKAREEFDSNIPDSSHQTVTSTPPLIAPFTNVTSSEPSLLVTPPPINTEATTITTSLPEITPFIALQLRVAKLEQEMSEVKKTDVLASIRSQVPTAVDNYLGTKLDDALLKVLERHTADLIEKYSVLPGPESVKNQESEKTPKESIKAKKEQDEEKQDSTYSIRSTDKVDLEEFDLKSALFSHMNKKKSANKNTTNYRLYHALMEALIADEDAMDKEVADQVKDHKRKHDSDDDEDDDDDEGPSAGSNQGRSTKKRRSDSAASGSAKPPPKDDDQSSQKPRESDASASKQHPSFTSTGWQITDTRDTGADSSMHRSDPESEHSEQSSDDLSKQDERNDSDMEDTDNAHIPKVSTTTWFKPIPESERPATPEPEWTISPNDFPEPEHNWANAYASSFKVPKENKLQRKTYDIGPFIKWFCRRTGKKKLCKADLEGPAFNLVKSFHKNSVFLQYQMDECHKLLTNKVDWSNPEGHQILRNIYEPLPLGGPPGQCGHRDKTSVRYLWPSLTGGLGWEEFYSSTNIVRPLIVKRQIARCEFSVYLYLGKGFQKICHPNDFEELLSYSIFKKSSTICPRTDKIVTEYSVNHVDMEWRLGSGQRMTKEEARLHQSNRETELRSEGSTKDILKMEMEMEIPSVKASANSDVHAFLHNVPTDWRSHHKTTVSDGVSSYLDIYYLSEDYSLRIEGVTRVGYQCQGYRSSRVLSAYIYGLHLRFVVIRSSDDICYYYTFRPTPTLSPAEPSGEPMMRRHPGYVYRVGSRGGIPRQYEDDKPEVVRLWRGGLADEEEEEEQLAPGRTSATVVPWTLQETVWMVEEEAYASREAWAHSIGLSQGTHQELQTHRDHVYAHETYLQAYQTQLQL
ncbi:hypothetical protein Tco_0600892 [Tanacetum coccineum]